LANPFSSLEGAVVGGGIGIAVATAAEPVFEPGRQAVWRSNPYAILVPETLAVLVAQGLVPFDAAAAQAKGNGIDANKFRALVEIAKTAPPVSEALELRRRQRITDDQLTHAMAKAQIEPQYWPALSELVDERLSPQVVALGIVRGIISDPGFLPVSPPSAVGKVPAFPTSTIKPLDEAASSGYSRERLFVETAIQGRPMGPEAAASAVFRSILEKVDFQRAVAEGDVRNEWAEAIFETARQIPSVADYVNARIRGWIDDAAMNAGVARHGMSAEDAHLLYLRTGRPPTVRQAMIGFRRGARVADFTETEDFYVRRAVEESDIRPEWRAVEHAANITYPSAFVMRMLVAEGAVTGPECADLLFEAGWRRDLADKTGAAFARAKTSGGQTHVQKAETQLWTTQHTSYKAGESDAGEVEATLDLLGVPQTEHARILALWNRERDIARKQLTPTQLKKAWKGAVTNPATGAPWTRDEALARLESMGYSPEDAETFLDE
jgi:hypothetical protein